MIHQGALLVSKKSKKRIDDLLVELGFVPDINHARATVMAGDVLVDDVPVDKAGARVDADANIRLRGDKCPYVSRGGLKLASALKNFGIDPSGKICMDIGASTGGFSDCLLQSGASKIYAVDVGRGQMDHRISRDPRVVVIDRMNIRRLEKSEIQEDIDLAVVDVSFISLEVVLPEVNRFMARHSDVVALIKPQFEVVPSMVGDGGIVRDPTARRDAARKVLNAGEELGWRVAGLMESPIKGAKGNIEFLVFFQVGSEP